MKDDPTLAEDVCRASASYLLSVWPEIGKLPASEQYERVTAHLRALLMAYRDGLDGWVVPGPSKN